VEIRKAGVSDAEALAGLYEELRKSELSLLGRGIREIQLNWEVKKTQGKIRSLLRSGSTAIFVAETDKRIAGFVTCGTSKGARGREGAFDIYVRAGYRREGVGKQLVETALSWFKRKGCKSVSLNVYSANKNAIRFYRSLGFRLVSENYKMKI
jgi:ribosomal protein S18 acetylase RimI-like enzyme